MKKIVIYGVGRRGVLLYRLLKFAKLDHLICAFCDKNYKNRTAPCPDLKILPYEQLDKEGLIFLVSPFYKEEIIKMLQKDQREYYVSFEEFVWKYYKDDERLMALTENFEIDDNNALLQEYYNLPNYKVVEYDPDRKLCYIFFSGNGICYSNSKGAFLSAMEEEDCYEWERLVEFSDIPGQAAKCIYIRDIRRTWYITGMNSDIDSIDKLAAFLKELCDGYDVITVGNSAGGYIASLIGAKLNAYMAFNFSGQFSLYEYFNVVTQGYFLNKHKEDRQISGYYNICNSIKGAVPIVYFYPAYCEQDQKQFRLAENVPNVMVFAVNSYAHDRTLKNRDIARLLTQNLSSIQALYRKYKDTVIDAENFIII